MMTVGDFGLIMVPDFTPRLSSLHDMLNQAFVKKYFFPEKEKKTHNYR